jgi:hypothetical protein
MLTAHQRAYKSTTCLSITQDNPNRLKLKKENNNNSVRHKQPHNGEVVHALFILFTHTAPINHNNTSLPTILHGKDLP